MAVTKISIQQISDRVFDLIGKNYLFTDSTNVTFDGVASEVERANLLNSRDLVPTWEEVERCSIVFVVDGTKDTIMATSKVISVDQTADSLTVVVDSTSSGLQDQIDDIVGRLDTDEADIVDRVTKDEAATFVKDIAYDSSTCTFTFTMYDDSTQDVDLPLESTVKDGSYDSTTKEMVLVLNDGAETEIRIPVDDLCDVYTGEDGTIVKVEVDSSNVISASINAGTITETELHQDIKDRFTGWDDSISDLQDQIAAIDTSVASKVSDFTFSTTIAATTFDLGKELEATDKVLLWFNGIREIEGDGFTVTRVAGSNTKITTNFDEPLTANDIIYVEIVK